MATVQSIVGVDQIKGTSGISMVRLIAFAVKVTGAYSTGTRPSVDFLAAIQAYKQGVTSATFHNFTCIRDHVTSAGVVYTCPNAQMTLSSTGNKVNTFKIYTGTGATDGDAGSGAEVADTTVIPDLTFQFLASVTFGAGTP